MEKKDLKMEKEGNCGDEGDQIFGVHVTKKRIGGTDQREDKKSSSSDGSDVGHRKKKIW